MEESVIQGNLGISFDYERASLIIATQILLHGDKG